MSTQPAVENVFDIRQARSHKQRLEDRYVDMDALIFHFSISRSAAKNYLRGGFVKNGEFRPYPQGPMPHLKTPGGRLRFNLRDCEEWMNRP